MIKCEICKKEYKSLQAISNHLIKTHKDFNSKIYFDNFISKNNICPICNKEKKFKNLIRGYDKTCGNKKNFEYIVIMKKKY
jgi:hypothetical protein